MADVFKEQLVKKLPDGRDLLIKIGTVVLGLIVMYLVLIFLNPIFPYVFAAIIFGVYTLFGRLNIEYEYILTNGELDIDAVFNKARRKRLYSGDLRNAQAFSHIGEKSFDTEFSGCTVKNYSSGRITDNTYAFIGYSKEKKLKIIFQPNEQMLDAIKPYIKKR